MVQLLLASTNRGVHARNAVRWRCVALLGRGEGGREGGVPALPGALPEAKLSMVGRHQASRAEGDTMISLE